MRRSKLLTIWSNFRGQPWIVQFGGWLAFAILAALALLPGAARADQPLDIPGQAICVDGKLVGIRLFIAAPGVIVLPLVAARRLRAAAAASALQRPAGLKEAGRSRRP